MRANIDLSQSALQLKTYPAGRPDGALAGEVELEKWSWRSGEASTCSLSVVWKSLSYSVINQTNHTWQRAWNILPNLGRDNFSSVCFVLVQFHLFYLSLFVHASCFCNFHFFLFYLLPLRFHLLLWCLWNSFYLLLCFLAFLFHYLKQCFDCNC